jgi:hypothetical protein
MKGIHALKFQITINKVLAIAVASLKKQHVTVSRRLINPIDC